MKTKKMKLTSMLLTIVMLFTIIPIGTVTVSANQSTAYSGGYSTNYTLTGNGASDIVAVAKAQLGKTQAQLKYSEMWCDNFVSDCAILANQASAVPQGGTVSDFRNKLINAGATQVSSPIAGDIVILYCNNCGSWAHAGIMYNSTHFYDGNNWTDGYSHVHSTQCGYYMDECYNTSYISYYYYRPRYSSQPSVTYSSIASGRYYIKNNSTGYYLDVESGEDVSQKNIQIYPFNATAAQQMYISPASSGYKIRPACSSTRLVNPYADDVVSGTNVNLFVDVGNSTQWWGFQAVSGGYVIRNMQNQNVCLTASGSNVIVSTYTGAASQKWSLYLDETYTISYNANGGSNAPASQSKPWHVDSITIPSTIPTRDGYEFVGWATSSNAQTATYLPGDLYKNNKNITLYAVWKLISYNINFDANGGRLYGEQSTYNVVKGNSFTIPDITAEKTGCAFLGWSTSPTETSAEYKSGDTITPTSDITLYAVYKDDYLSYTISDGQVTITDCNSAISGDIVIPSEIDGYPVTAIGYNAFYNCSSLTSITIPDSVTSIGSYAFYNCSSLTSITIPDSVTSIGSNAFEGCSNLESITIPNGVTGIANNAFYNTGYYNNSDNWENGVLYIGNHLIRANSSELPNSYAIKDGTVNIFGYAFSDCSNLTSITIPDSVTSIGSGAFNDCNSLKNIIIPDSVTSIESSAFFGCSSLKNIIIPDSVTSIESSAFFGCSSLKSINIPDSVTSIRSGVFGNCTSLENINVDENNSYYSSVNGVLFNKDKTELMKYPIGKTDISYTIPDDVTSIGYEAFYNCTSLESITIPNSVTSIGSDAFYGCNKLKTAGPIGGGYNIEFGWATVIPRGAFYNCDSLTSITIPNSVTSIEYNAFALCDSLTSVTIPDSVTSIGDYAFYKCRNLKSINIAENNECYTSVDGVLFNKDKTKLIQYPIGKTDTSYIIPDSVTSIEYTAFNDCTSLKNVTIPDSMTSIIHGAFSGCTGLTSITIPDSVTSIEYNAFSGCTGLKNITIPDGVKYIDEHTFYNCSSLTSITIPDSVTSIGYDAFAYCSSLTSITIPDSVTSIGSGAFYDCSSLTSITIPDSVTSIGSDAFDNTAYYNNSDNWENGVLYIGNHLIKAYSSGLYAIKDGTRCIAAYAFSFCSSLTSITIPDSVTSIGYDAFAYCSSLESITIPDGVTSIEKWAFYNCSSLTSITIPDSVTSIGSNAFYNCSSLTNITIPDSVTSIGSDAFDNTAYYNNSDNWENGVLYIGNHLIKVNSSELSGAYTIKDGTISIAPNTFSYCSSLTSITIPDSVTSIGNSAFWGCTSLKNVTIPDSVTNMSGNAFYGCSSLESINVDDNHAYYSSVDGVLFNKDKTKLIQYPAGKTDTSYIIPDNVTSISYSAFYGCTSLKNITIPDGVKYIDEHTFYNCSSLTSITIPDSVTSIGMYAFYKCSSLESIIIPNGVIGIDYMAFADCTSLTSITIPNSVTSIWYNAFYGCDDLTIYGYKNSYAKTYADENDIPFVAIKKPIYIDYSSLETALSSVSEYSETSYTTQSYRALKVAVAAGDLLIQHNCKTQSIIDSITAKINEAVDNLVEEQQTPTTDKADYTQLQCLLNITHNYKESDYTKASYNALKAANTAANILVANNCQTQSIINSVNKTLENAINGLKKV